MYKVMILNLILMQIVKDFHHELNKTQHGRDVEVLEA